MTERGRYSRKNRQPRRPHTAPAEGTGDVRIVGAPETVDKIVNRLVHVVDAVSISSHVPRRDEPGQVSVYVTVRPDA